MAKQREPKTQEEALELLVGLLPSDTSCTIERHMSLRKNRGRTTNELSYQGRVFLSLDKAMNPRHPTGYVSAHAEAIDLSKLVGMLVEQFREKLLADGVQVEGWEPMAGAKPCTSLVPTRGPRPHRPTNGTPRLTNGQPRLTFKG